jgi:hypothetical protein
VDWIPSIDFYELLFVKLQAKAEDIVNELRIAKESLLASNTKDHAQLSNKLESDSMESKRMESEVRRDWTHLSYCSLICFGLDLRILDEVTFQ